MAILKTKQPAKFSALAGLIGLGMIIGFFGNTANASVSGQNQLSSSNPAPNQVVSVPPTQLQLVFQNPLANPEVVTSMGLSLACNGTLVGLGVPQLGTDYKTVSAALTQIPPSGLCTVSWALPDKSLGSFSFTSAVEIQTTIAGATDGVTDADGTPSTPTIIGETIEQQQSGPRVGGILGLLRVLEYLLMSALFGGLALIVTAWPEGTTYGVTLRYMRLAWFACVVNMFLILVLSTMRAESQGFIASINPFGWFGALNTGSGAILILRFVLILACGWVAMKPERINDPASQFVAGSIIISMIGTLGLSRLGQDVAVFSYVLGIIHAIAMAYWIGGLLLLSRVVLIGPGTSDLVSAVRAFTKHAVLAFGVTAFTGMLLVYLLDGSSIFTSGHGRIGVFKVIFVSVMVYLTLLVKQFAAKRLIDGDNLTGRMAWRLRRAVSVELVFALIALMFTSWLAATTPPKAKAEIRTTSAIYSFREELKNNRFHVVISLTPGVTGTNAMRIELIQPQRINNFAVKMVPQAIGYSGIQINVPLTRQGAAIVAGDGSFILNAPGIWNIEVSGTTTTGDLTPLATTLAVTQAPDAQTATTLPTATTIGG
ncbi:MAG: hypothetical protein O3A62_02525 [Actinomycetota bacterium]|nr:hypothetical protein [Actinomycetota bacterium]MDA3003933.1 hypothetical protein [Actinomycetota bacterium]